MDVFRPDQILALGAFLAALGGLWLLARRNGGAMGRHLAGRRRVTLADSVALGARDRALILAVDGREFLVLRLAGSAPVVTELGQAQAVAATPADARCPA